MADKVEDEDEFFEAEEDDHDVQVAENGILHEDVPLGSISADAVAQISEWKEEREKLVNSGALEAFLTAIGELAEHPYAKKESNLIRFLRADAGNVTLAAERFKAHIEWREKIKPDTVICQACERNPSSHYMHNVGFDKFKRPVIYSCFQLARDRANVNQNVEHITANLEALTLHMAPGVETYVWICDFYGFGYQDCSLSLGMAAIQLFSKHYPQRLGAFIFVGAPFIFSAVWSQLKLVMDQRQVHKVRFVEGPLEGSGVPLREKLGQIFEPHMVDWLLDEMVENRDPGKAAKKAWLTAALGKLDVSSNHNLLGPPERLSCLEVDLKRREKALEAAQSN